MINEYEMRDRVAAMSSGEREALPKIVNNNGMDYASCPECHHYHAMMPSEVYIPVTAVYFRFLYCRDCGTLGIADPKQIVVEDDGSGNSVTADGSLVREVFTSHNPEKLKIVPAKQRVVISIRGGLVSSVYGDDASVEVLVVDHDNLESALSGGNDFDGAEAQTVIPINELTGPTANAVKAFDGEPLNCEACGDEFDAQDAGSYDFCTRTCEKRHWRL